MGETTKSFERKNIKYSFENEGFHLHPVANQCELTHSPYSHQHRTELCQSLLRAWLRQSDSLFFLDKKCILIQLTLIHFCTHLFNTYLSVILHSGILVQGSVPGTTQQPQLGMAWAKLCWNSAFGHSWANVGKHSLHCEHRTIDRKF